MAEITPAEHMVVAMAEEAARLDFVVQGIATPLVSVALALAKRCLAPELRFGFAIGNSFGSEFSDLSLTDPEATTLGKAQGLWTFTGIAAEFLPHVNPAEFFRPAQIDPTGATNNLWLGPPEDRLLRLPGSAGIPDVSPTTQSARIYIPRHSRRVFVETLDALSGLGYEPGVRPGPRRVFTNLATLTIQEGRLGIEALMPGVTRDEVQEATSFRLAGPPSPPTREDPAPEVLEVLRHEVDPKNIRDLDFLGTKDRLQAMYRLARIEQNTRRRDSRDAPSVSPEGR